MNTPQDELALIQKRWGSANNNSSRELAYRVIELIKATPTVAAQRQSQTPYGVLLSGALYTDISISETCIHGVCYSTHAIVKSIERKTGPYKR